MKYNELHRILKKAGCQPLAEQQSGHPLWYCPATGQRVKTSNHLGEEVKKGTLNAILKAAGLK